MPYTEPTVASFVARFPRFESADEDLIASLLAEAISLVDDSWLERDRATAQLYLTAHWLVRETNNSTATGPGIIQSESFGPMSRSYAIDKSASGNADLGQTEFGRRYLELRSANFPGILVVG